MIVESYLLFYVLRNMHNQLVHKQFLQVLWNTFVTIVSMMEQKCVKIAIEIKTLSVDRITNTLIINRFHIYKLWNTYNI